MRQARAEVVRVALEYCLHIRLIALQQEGPGADGALDFLQVAVLLHYFGGDDPHAHGVGEDVEQPDERLFEEELHRVAVHHLHTLQGLQQLPLRITFLRQKAVEGKFHIRGHQLAAVDWWLIMPADAFSQMKEIGRVVRRFPAFGEIRLDDEGAWLHVCADFMPQELTVDEAQRGIGLEVARELRIKVHGIPPPDA